jgi:hypothetical protein
MDIVSFWKLQTEKWNEELKCGFCWEFSAPLIESSVNIVQSEEDKECCVKLMFLQDKQPAFSTNNTYNATTNLLTNQICATNFQLLVLLNSELGVNNYNEIKGHTTTQSNWERILQVLQECLSCDANLAFCEILGSVYRVTNWSGTQVINYTGSVYCGYRINVSFQKSN